MTPLCPGTHRPGHSRAAYGHTTGSTPRRRACRGGGDPLVDEAAVEAVVPAMQWAPAMRSTPSAAS
ncbi:MULTISPECIES: hypothetical protein [unclassified Streptomyces]|uniref:hypothetical protein n=1 Tax=unclassified Streptomyces TaxID=2593676 RepID=UPI0033B8E7EB